MTMDQMEGKKRTHYCGILTAEQIGKTVVVCGFVQKQRDLGNLIFIDLRDRTGIVQLAFDDATARGVFEKAGKVRSEYVLMAEGEVRRRESMNKEIPTGEIEVYVTELHILSQAKTPPFEIVEDSNVKEELRLKYRYLDLRRSDLQRNIIMRHKITKATRDYFDSQGFIEIETPILIKSTPEGARDFLVPSRVQPHSFYALPQSPQLYKQLLMVSGFDRYIQLARCFRDEDQRADRQPEFTQIDMEISFVDENDVIAVNEGFVQYLFHTVLGKEVSLPLPRLTYQEAMERYGSDKPDTRFGVELIDLSDLVEDCGFAVFSSACRVGGSVRAICVPGGAERYSRKEIDKLVEFVRGIGAKGLAWAKINPDGVQSSFAKFLSEEEMQAIVTRMEASVGDLVLIVADADRVVSSTLGALRLEVGRKLGLIDESRDDFLWITEFPFFEWDDDLQTYVAMHHPFTAPMAEDIPLLDSEKGNVRARAYDLVLNGVEMGSGSIRITDPDLQKRMFAALGLSEEEAQAKFGFLTDAFQYGAPPHGGMGLGLDRLVMVMLHCKSLRDVVAFPKMQNLSEPMTECPSPVDEEQLNELHIALRQEETE